MAETRFTMKQGDTLPILEVTLFDGAGVVVDLSTAASISLNMKPTGTFGAPYTDAAEIHGTPTAGIVRYHWPVPQALDPGLYNAEIEVTWEDGNIETYPNQGYFQVVVTAQLDI